MPTRLTTAVFLRMSPLGNTRIRLSRTGSDAALQRSGKPFPVFYNIQP